MGASIFWRPVEVGRQSLRVSTPSSFLEAMRRAFGSEPPWRLGPEDLPVLRGMAAAGGRWNNETENDYERLIRAIENGDEPRTIEVWAEY